VADILRAADGELHKLENAVIRAAVNVFYVSPSSPRETPRAYMEAELENRVKALVAAIQAIDFEER
jgi:hypothetical protein